MDPVFEIHYLKMTQVLCDLASINRLAEYCTDLLTFGCSANEFMPWTNDRIDGVDIMDSVALFGVGDCQFTAGDIDAFEAFATSLK